MHIYGTCLEGTAQRDTWRQRSRKKTTNVEHRENDKEKTPDEGNVLNANA